MYLYSPLLYLIYNIFLNKKKQFCFLDFDLPEDKVQTYIAPKLKIISEEIHQKKSSFPYLWETLEEEKRSVILENYLKSIGYVFDKKIIEETIEKVKRIKRKAGTRPVNYLRQRLL